VEQVLRKRAYLQPEGVEAALLDPIARTVQPGARIRHWYRVDLAQA